MKINRKKIFHQRKKGDPISYDGSVDPIPLPYPRQKDSKLPSPPDTLTLKIKASPQDWHTLYLLAQADPEYLGKLILINVANPVYEKFLSREELHLPGGLHSEVRQQFMSEARNYTAASFTILSHWAKTPSKSWPEYLRIIIDEAEEKLGKESIWPPRKKTIDVIAVVRFLLNLEYGGRGEMLGFDDVELMENEIFRKIYFDKNKIEPAKHFFQKSNFSLTTDELRKLII